MPPFHSLNSEVYFNSFLTSNSKLLICLIFPALVSHYSTYCSFRKHLLVSGWVSFLSLLFFSFFQKHLNRCIHLTFQEKIRVSFTYNSKSNWDGLKCVDYLGDNFHLYNIESFSSGIGVLSTYSSPLLCSSRRFYYFFIWYLLCLFLGILYLLLLLEDPHLPHYVVLIIVDIYRKFLILYFVIFLPEFLLVLFWVFLVDNHSICRSTQKSYLLLCLWLLLLFH